MNFEDLDNRETFDVTELKPRYGIGGADLASTVDLCAAKVIFKVPDNPKIYVLQMYWLAEDLLGKECEKTTSRMTFGMSGGCCGFARVTVYTQNM